MSDDYGDIIHRMMRDLQADDDSPNNAPRCEGCRHRMELAPFQLRVEWQRRMGDDCAECRALAAMVEDGAL
jgi:hypothetical protein